MTDQKKKSWKTTASGWAILVGAGITALGFMFDGNPETNPDWSAVIDGLRTTGIGIFGIGGAVLGAKAKDKDKTGTE